MTKDMSILIFEPRFHGYIRKITDVLATPPLSSKYFYFIFKTISKVVLKHIKKQDPFKMGLLDNCITKFNKIVGKKCKNINMDKEGFLGVSIRKALNTNSYYGQI